jgi:7-keto-8-aminopelargonate synthetase-like enzyme
MGRPVVSAPSTTLAHLAALPVLVGDDDAILLDQFAHASLHMATELVDDVPIELVRHNRVDLLERRVAQLSETHERVWYVCDGLYSMLGDFAPFSELALLLDRYPKLHLYVDDAHSMSWFGDRGRGAALSALGQYDRVVVALSMAKAFGSSGGILAVPSEELRDRIRRCGGPMIFSGPLPPAVLGACLASAKLHLSEEMSTLQADLRARIDHARQVIARCQLRTATEDRTPIVMVQYDSGEVAMKVVAALRTRGYYTCPSTFPAVPVNKPSIRFTISRHNSFEDIEDFIAVLAEVSSMMEGDGFEANTGVRAIGKLPKLAELD